MKDIKQRIIKILKSNVEELEQVDINDSVQLISGGFVDSFDIVNIISLIETEFSITIDLDGVDLEQFDKLDSICCVVSERLGDK